MGTIADKLLYLNETKTAIKDAIVAKGVTVADTDTFRSYADKIGEISGEPVEKTKFGVSIDDMIGNASGEGTLSAPTSRIISVNLSGVKNIYTYALEYAFYNKYISDFMANDVTYINPGSMTQCCAASIPGCPALFFSMDALERITVTNALSNVIKGRTSVTASFKKLKTVTANSAFSGFASNAGLNIETAFPALEEISGNGAFNGFCDYAKSILTFKSVKKIVGAASQYSSTFGSYYTDGSVWNFPSATEISGYIWNISKTGEIHFAVANQAAIEACDGYANKWGFTGATIYFDL